MKLATLPVAVRHVSVLSGSKSLGALASRHYSTQTSSSKSANPSSKRRAVTPFNDDGRVNWTDLSRGEKAARATQQTFNFGFILAGLGLTGAVVYLLFTEVFSPDSRVANFSRAVDLIKKDTACQAALGDPKKILAHGEETYSRWKRSRPIASTISQDRFGVEHLKMHFYLQGPLNSGIAHLHMTRHPNHGDGDFEYKYLFVDVRGHQRIYLKNADDDNPFGSEA
ncbi:unnamed protein product [Parascedosporium putredinis]|uniref:Mitochondrial import inner membrane translocase subunit Tim21 n=1 Tax=Parascedosporium putredinis TaxID=1442378 RepID=A0A9P1H3Q7_9PEZI|nr:unnamed protein product [Parascedosporium putredinis]CAI7995010.1 unnamed protein product [Parascedosporium putredinis]